MVLAVLVNLLVARHYRRWDWTQGGLYTLSDATVSTLRALEEPIRVYVLLSEGVGAGIVVHGHLHSGASGRAGELGHVPVERDGRICRCGAKRVPHRGAGSRASARKSTASPAPG